MVARAPGRWYSGPAPAVVDRIASENALSFDLFDRNAAAAPTGRWRATFWRRSRA